MAVGVLMVLVVVSETTKVVAVLVPVVIPAIFLAGVYRWLFSGFRK
ncbi:hypothetical protein [Actinokineospora spheciospongiae]|nr:hypothetical protein [Actinokineospora spheciospongiae]PWW53675.1 hypothetical protein DFQ13_11558 [Actinokineospora spheciospongiae]